MVQNYVLIASFRVTSFFFLVLGFFLTINIDIKIFWWIFFVVVVIFYDHDSCEYTDALKPDIAGVAILGEY